MGAMEGVYDSGKSTATGILSPERLAPTKSLYHLRYPGPHTGWQQSSINFPHINMIYLDQRI